MNQMEGFGTKDIEEKFIAFQIKESPESERFIRDLIRRQLITFPTMRNYVIIKLYDDYLKSNKGNIVHTLEDFSYDFNITERWVRKIHKKYTRIY